jgi:hypothetical protein
VVFYCQRDFTKDIFAVLYVFGNGAINITLNYLASRTPREGSILAEITREISYDDEDQPIMILRPKVPSTNSRPVSFAIRMSDLWKYSESHNPNFEKYMFHICTQIYMLFNLGVLTSPKLARIAWVIQGGIDDMLGAQPPQRKKEVVGEISGSIGGEKIHTKMMEEGQLLQ